MIQDQDEGMALTHEEIHVVAEAIRYVVVGEIHYVVAGEKHCDLRLEWVWP